jgi:hypothetical protein
VGKSALLAYARAKADGMRVLQTAGVQSEAEIEFAALYQLLRPALDGVGSLPPPQAAALGAALGMEPGRPANRFLIGAAVLSVLSAAAGDRPLLCLVDDAGWLDYESAVALAFAARRLEAEAVVVIVAARSVAGTPFAGFPSRQIEGLSRPVNLIGRRPLRLLAGNALVIGGGAATYLLLRDLANHRRPSGLACGGVISAALVVALVFEGWPGALLRRPAAGRMVTIVLIAAVAVGLNRALAGYADSVHWVRATADDWVTVAGLTFSAVGIILHVAIGQRWPLSPTTADEDSEQQAARARATR